jgi:TonB family protein
MPAKSIRIRALYSAATPDKTGPLVSALLHALFVATVVIAPAAATIVLTDPDSLPEGLRFLVPPSASPASAMRQVTFEQTGGDGGDIQDGVESDEGRRRAGNRNASARDAARATSSADISLDAFGAGSSAELSDVFQVVEVDSAAEREPDSYAPAYPPELMASGVEGWAAVRFVVDTNGRVDIATVQSVGFTAPEFHRAVRDALPRMKFRPARIGGKPVRQLAEQLFKFEIQRPDPFVAMRSER